MESLLIAVVAVIVAAAAAAWPLRHVLRARRVRLRLQFADGAPWLRHGQFGLTGQSSALSGRAKAPDGSFPAHALIEPPRFALCDQRFSRTAPALMISLALHGAGLAAAPDALAWIGRALEPQQLLELRNAQVVRLPLLIRAPEARRLVFGAPLGPSPPRARRAPARPADRARAAMSAEPAIPNPSARVESLPAPAVPSATAAMDARRPERKYRVVAATTLLQPRKPARAREMVELPAFAAWTGQVPETPAIQAPGSRMAGMLAAAPPPKAPVLPFRTGAPVRPEPPRLEEPRLALPPPGVPVESPPSGGPPGSGVPAPGEPVSVISISPIPLRPGEILSVPPVNQIGGGVDDDGAAGAKPAAADPPRPSGPLPKAERAPAGERAASRVAAQSEPGSVMPQAADKAPAAGPRAGGAAAEPAPANGAVRSARADAGALRMPSERDSPAEPARPAAGATVRSGNLANGAPETPRETSVRNGGGGSRGTEAGPAGAGAAVRAARSVRLGGQMARVLEKPDGGVVLEYPKDGQFDVVVVESAFPQALSGLAKRLSGSPVYTAYLDVGAGREWMLYYCAADKAAAPSGNSMVVTLEDPPPLKAPYIQRAELPAEDEWKSSWYQAFHGFVTAQGRLERVTAVRAGSNPGSLLKLLPQWEFRPAMRGGKAVEIEVLLVIPPERAP